MIPILNSDQMRAADAVATKKRGVDTLVCLAGTAVALEARRLLGGCYGARVTVVTGPGLNGADGRVAAKWLATRGARVQVLEWNHASPVLDGADLVIDAAFGLGCSRPFLAPMVRPGTKVLAVDLPSGVDADTGALLGEPLAADVTVALGAFKPAHFDGPASDLVGRLRFAGLGIVADFNDGLMTDDDLMTLVRFDPDDHKWRHAIQVVAGSASMPGAAYFVLAGALAGGASMIRLSARADAAFLAHLPPEVVLSLGANIDSRCRAVVAGPGLGDTAPTLLRTYLEDVRVPVVLDADGLNRVLVDELSPRDGSWILTPHEGEFTRLTGSPLGPNRFQAVRELARQTQCVVLLKGPTTIVANPSGSVRVVNSGTPALASAGTGDVLAGLIAATIARGHEPFDAAALGAHLHGRAGALQGPYTTATQIVATVRGIIDDLTVDPKASEVSSLVVDRLAQVPPRATALRTFR